MAQTHHRKSHKQHLQNYKQHQHGADNKSNKQQSVTVLSVIGAAVGMAIGYMASSGKIIWMAGGAILFGLIGFLIGKKIDK